MMKFPGLFALLLVVGLLAGCGRAANQVLTAPPAVPAATPEPSAAATTVPTEAPAATEAPAPTEAAEPTAVPVTDPTAACPAETPGTVAYVSTENGYCLRYPAELRPVEDVVRPEEVFSVVGAPLDPNAMESAAVSLRVAYNGPADGLDAAQYAAKWVEVSFSGLTLPQEPVTIGGQPAVVVSGIPGMGDQRAAFIVANGVKYQIVVQPDNIPELVDQIAAAWDAVTQSIVFFPPQNTRRYVTAAEVCPAETADAKVVTNLAYGYCYLYPADFAPNPEFPVQITGGPDLGSVEGFEHIRASITVASFPLVDQTPEQAMTILGELFDQASMTETTIGGYPAVVFDFTGGPWRQRNARILVDDLVYTFVAQPWDPELFPQAIADVERLWGMATATIAFFDPWR